MSLILDALKKSELERNRHTGPGLHEVRIAPPPQGLPMWGIVLGVVLLANLGLLTWLVARPSLPVTTAAVPAAAPALPVAAALPPAMAASASGLTQIVDPVPPAVPSVLPDPTAATTPLPVAGFDPAPATYANERAPAAVAPRGTPETAADRSLPSYQDLNASGANLPPLRLSLHVYDREPALRYVLLNSTQLHEGESTPDGLRLERVTETGVIVSWRNRRFSLSTSE
jgi:general secretion pathway protein B